MGQVRWLVRAWCCAHVQSCMHAAAMTSEPLSQRKVHRVSCSLYFVWLTAAHAHTIWPCPMQVLALPSVMLLPLTICQCPCTTPAPVPCACIHTPCIHMHSTLSHTTPWGDLASSSLPACMQAPGFPQASVALRVRFTAGAVSLDLNQRRGHRIALDCERKTWTHRGLSWLAVCERSAGTA